MPTADHSVTSIKHLACDLQTWPSSLTAKALARAAKRAGASSEELAPHFKRVHRAATDLLRPGTRPDPAYAELRQAVAILDSVVKVRRKTRNRLQ
jgi:hypothetical protein